MLHVTWAVTDIGPFMYEDMLWSVYVQRTTAIMQFMEVDQSCSDTVPPLCFCSFHTDGEATTLALRCRHFSWQKGGPWCWIMAVGDATDMFLISISLFLCCCIGKIHTALHRPFFRNYIFSTVEPPYECLGWSSSLLLQTEAALIVITVGNRSTIDMYFIWPHFKKHKLSFKGGLQFTATIASNLT